VPFTFGAASQHQLIVRKALELSEQDFAVFEGKRSQERQNALFAAGASRTLNSLHIPDPAGVVHAVDLVPFIGGRVQWQTRPCDVVAKVMHRAAELLDVGVTWGAVWDRDIRALDPTDLGGEIELYVQRFRARHRRAPLVDRPHFQVDR
jgi:peptidoglycan LD-endopeptidase CwlK